MTTHVYSEEAEEELVSALNYYRAEARLGAAEKFIERVDQAIESILRNPEGCPAFGRRIRRQRVWSFPYDLLFRFENNLVTIVAVAHHSRESAFWKHRT